ncbi:hypothetical protein AEMCBJ_14515 [Cupriavidus necator]|uniref:hypothetical protein n=1 Tax=Cupriavidus necator TaxID=106590 RepID=UPI003F731450
MRPVTTWMATYVPTFRPGALAVAAALSGPGSYPLASTVDLPIAQLPSSIMSAAATKCRAAGEEVRQNPNPCPTNDMVCAMKVQQAADAGHEACKQAMMEMKPPPLPFGAAPTISGQ